MATAKSMEKKESAQKFKSFLKKNVYYIIMAVCLLAIAGMITATVLLNKSQSTKEGINDTLEQVTPTTSDLTDKEKEGDKTPEPTSKEDENKDKETEKETEGEKENEQPTNTEPTPVAIVFDAPVAAVDIACDYSMDALVWNSTLQHSAVHNGIDFRGADGTDVLCVYDGVVTAVGYDVLNGYTVTVQHNDTLYTSYGSMNEPTVKVGQNVRKGEVLGTMGNTASKEYSMGPHLHFSVYENNKVTDPYKYMAIGGK